MKEAPKDQVACEATVLHQADVIQGGCDFAVVNPETLALVAINQSLYAELGNPTSLSDFIQCQDCTQLSADIDLRGPLTPRIVTRLDGQKVWARPYRNNGVLGIEFSPKDAPLTANQKTHYDFANVVRTLSCRRAPSAKGEAPDEGSYFTALAQGVRKLTDFDRVMVYKFDPDWNGEVIAEDTGIGIAKFLGLKFPSGDIPRPARALFLHSKVRQIIDVQAAPEPMIAPQTQAPFAFDQTDCTYRFAASVHLDYLRNMGVTATLTIAIHVGGRLWGLLACHHQSGPHRVSLSNLTLCHVLSDLASNHVAREEDQRQHDLSAAMNTILSQISMTTMTATTEDDLANIVGAHQDDILNLLGADGFQFESETANWIVGDVPVGDAMHRVNQMAEAWLRDHQRGLFATADLPGFFDDGSDGSGLAGGLVYARSWDNKTSLKLFRQPTPIADVWAGDVDAKSNYPIDNPNVLHPRNSFDAYMALSKGRSLNWRSDEIAAVEALQNGLRNIEMSFHKSLREQQLRNSNARMRHALKQADYQAHHDPLTGLLNRRGLRRFVSSLVQRDQRKDRLWFCHIDLDHFKLVNDNKGHHVGDLTLARVGEVLSNLPPHGSRGARVGGDEFALLLSGNLSKTAVREYCETLIATLSREVQQEGETISCACTIGATEFVPGTVELDQLLKESDLALYQGKRAGRGRIMFYTEELMVSTGRKRAQDADLLRGVAAGEFTPYFQPQFDCQTRKVVGFEALSRWQHPQKGVLLPDAFLSRAAELGVLGDIDRQIFAKCVQQQKDWLAKTGDRVRVSVNISVDRLQSRDLICDLDALGAGARDISLELLESIYLDEYMIDYDGILSRLRETGVGIEIDDFGSGQTSILAVVSVRPDRLKIDKRLIDPIVQDTAARGLVKAIMDIGKQLGIQITAEGVETEEQLEVLRQLQCDRVQGYLFAKPMAASLVEAGLLRSDVFGSSGDDPSDRATLN